MAAARVGTAIAADVLSGKTFTNSSSSGLNGSMTNQGTKTYTINPGGSQTIPQGYHSGSGTVTANANQNSGTYTFASGNGDTVDMGINNTYRYVNATNVYNKGKSDSSLSTLVVRTDGNSNYTYFETSFIKSIGFTKLNQQATSGSGYGTIWVSTATPFASGTFTEIGTRAYNSTVTFTSAHLNNYNYVFFSGINVKFTFSK